MRPKAKQTRADADARLVMRWASRQKPGVLTENQWSVIAELALADLEAEQSAAQSAAHAPGISALS